MLATLLWTLPMARPAGAALAECLVRFEVDGAAGNPEAPTLVCRDGDTACDRDGAENGRCEIDVAVCGGFPPCPQPVPAAIHVRGAGSAALADAVAALEATTAPVCTPPVPTTVERGSAPRRRRVLRVRAADASGRLRDRDRLRLVCEGPTSPRVVVVTSDFETGVLVRAPLAAPRRMQRAPSPIHADALVRTAGDTAFVVNRFLGDNLQVLNDRLGTRVQCSTGVGSNPHDVAVVAPDKAYVTRYDREAMWVVDPSVTNCERFRRGTVDLSALADGDGLPEMSQMVVVGTQLFVNLQRLDRRAGFTGTRPSMLAVIDVATDTVTGAIELLGRNAFADASGLQREPGTGKLLVPQAGSVYRTGDGGIERVDPVALVSEGFVVTEDALGGTVTDFVVVGPQKGYAIVIDESLRNLVVSFDLQTGVRLARVFASPQFLADLAVGPDGTVWLADRALPRPGLRLFDPVTDEQRTRGVIDTGLPPFSIGFLGGS
jgi:hypothetical protein